MILDAGLHVSCWHESKPKRQHEHGYESRFVLNSFLLLTLRDALCQTCKYIGYLCAVAIEIFNPPHLPPATRQCIRNRSYCDLYLLTCFHQCDFRCMRPASIGSLLAKSNVGRTFCGHSGKTLVRIYIYI